MGVDKRGLVGGIRTHLKININGNMSSRMLIKIESNVGHSTNWVIEK